MGRWRGSSGHAREPTSPICVSPACLCRWLWQPNGVFVHPHQGARVIYLNREKTLNALDYTTLRAIRKNLVEVGMPLAAKCRERPCTRRGSLAWTSPIVAPVTPVLPSYTVYIVCVACS